MKEVEEIEIKLICNMIKYDNLIEEIKIQISYAQYKHAEENNYNEINNNLNRRL